MNLQRLLKHLCATKHAVKRHFPASSLDAIKAAIGASEAAHSGEIRLAVEAALSPAQLLGDMTPRERALELFSTLRIWDTQDNNGVLIYVLHADHAIEIVADRGIHARAGQQTWQGIASQMQQAFAAGNFEAGAIAGIEAVTAQLVRHFPAAVAGANELPDDVSLL